MLTELMQFFMVFEFSRTISGLGSDRHRSPALRKLHRFDSHSSGSRPRVASFPIEFPNEVSTPGRHGDSEMFVFVLVEAEVCGCEPVERRKRFEKVGLVEASVLF